MSSRSKLVTSSTMMAKTTTTSSSTTTSTMPPKLLGDDDDVLGVLDMSIATGFRLWMLLAMILAILLIMLIMVCCVMKIRIPRTKREIELTAARRKKRRGSGPVDLRNYQAPDRSSRAGSMNPAGCNIVVMTTGPSTERINLLTPGSSGYSPGSQHRHHHADAESDISCTSCATSDPPTRNQTPFNGSTHSLNQSAGGGPHRQQQQHLLTAAAAYFQSPAMKQREDSPKIVLAERTRTISETEGGGSLLVEEEDSMTYTSV